MVAFTVRACPLAGLKAVERRRIQDDRGFFSRFFCAQELRTVGFDAPVAQINHTLTRRCGAVRGLHYQYPPHAEVKYISVVKGRVFDVAVDLRAGSPTFLKWHAEELSAANATSLLVPRGFAHGFQTLEDDCELIYLHSAAYAPGSEAAVNVRDPALAIEWPLDIAELSSRDAAHAFVSSDFAGLQL